MIKIRKSVFETNSSSSHSLILSNDFEIKEEDILKLKNLNCEIEVLPYTPTPEYEYDIYETIESKLQYLYTAAVQAGLVWNEDINFWDEWESNVWACTIMEVLTEICPSVKFKRIEEEYHYALEDVECLFERGYDDKIKAEPLFDKNKLIKFLLKGTVYNISRDGYSFEEESKVDKLRSLAGESYIGIYFAG